MDWKWSKEEESTIGLIRDSAHKFGMQNMQNIGIQIIANTDQANTDNGTYSGAVIMESELANELLEKLQKAIVFFNYDK